MVSDVSRTWKLTRVVAGLGLTLVVLVRAETWAPRLIAWRQLDQTYAAEFPAPATLAPSLAGQRVLFHMKTGLASPTLGVVPRTSGPGVSGGYDDPYLRLQHGIAAMQVESAHRWASGLGVRIAVIDTGVDAKHPELRQRVALARDFVERPPAPGDQRHGTAVAGIIASSAGNGLGIVGVAPDVELLALKACWHEPFGGTEGICDRHTLAKALAFAVELRPDIINLSLAGPADPLLERLVATALERGIVVVAAASDRPGEEFASRLPGVLAVRAAAAGPVPATAGLGAEPLAAPGDEVIAPVPGGGFAFVSGSSAAAAHVTGVAALLLERQPSLGAERLLALLRQATRRVESPGAGPITVVNACAALAEVTPGVACDEGNRDGEMRSPIPGSCRRTPASGGALPVPPIPKSAPIPCPG